MPWRCLIRRGTTIVVSELHVVEGIVHAVVPDCVMRCGVIVDRWVSEEVKQPGHRRAAAARCREQCCNERACAGGRTAARRSQWVSRCQPGDHRRCVGLFACGHLGGRECHDGRSAARWLCHAVAHGFAIGSIRACRHAVGFTNGSAGSDDDRANAHGRVAVVPGTRNVRQSHRCGGSRACGKLICRSEGRHALGNRTKALR